MLGAAYVETLSGIGRRAGLDAVGVAPARPFDETRTHLETRRAAGLHGGMAFTYRNPARSTDPSTALPGAAALLVGARGYTPPATSPPGPVPRRPQARVAAYARADYYTALKAALAEVADRLKADGWRARVVVDDNALIDREAAYRAGIGWYGKNSNLLLPGRGSWVVLGAVVTTAPLPASPAPVADGCGTCRRCIDGCPTGAIVAPGVVDARRCLAWLLQATGSFPQEFREALGDRIYGCDDCQEVCPPNRRATGGNGVVDPETGEVDVLTLLSADDATLLAAYGRWYIPERDPRYIRRNALVVLGNTGNAADRAVVETVRRYLNHPDPLLREHAEWAARRLRICLA